MIDRDVVELIHREIDGMTSPEEAARLQQIFASNAEARKLADDLRALARGFAAMPRPEPPRTLKPAIMRSLPPIATRPRRQVTTSWRELFTLRPLLMFAGGVVAGLLVFAMVNGIVDSSGIRDQDLVGSMSLTGTNRAFVPGDKHSFVVGALKGTLETRYAGDLCLLKVRIESPTAVSARLQTVSQDVRISALQPVGSAYPDLVLRGNEVVVSSVVSGGCDLLLTGIPEIGTPLSLSVDGGGNVVLQKEILLKRPATQ